MGFKVVSLRLASQLPVRFAAVSLPFSVEFVLENFGASFTGQAGLLEAQLAHLHVVDTCGGELKKDD